MRSHGRQPAAHSGVLGITALFAFIVFILQSGFLLILGLLGFEESLTAFGEGSLFGQVLATAFGLLPLFLSIWALLPAWSVAMTLLYFDRRIRLEGHDIEVLTRAIPLRRANRFDV